jgi:hypothetical protein
VDHRIPRHHHRARERHDRADGEEGANPDRGEMLDPFEYPGTS